MGRSHGENYHLWCYTSQTHEFRDKCVVIGLSFRHDVDIISGNRMCNGGEKQVVGRARLYFKDYVRSIAHSDEGHGVECNGYLMPRLFLMGLSREGLPSVLYRYPNAIIFTSHSQQWPGDIEEIIAAPESFKFSSLLSPWHKNHSGPT